MAHHAQIGLSIGVAAGGYEALTTITHAAIGIGEKVLSTIAVTIAATLIGFFMSRWLNRKFPSPPAPPGEH